MIHVASKAVIKEICNKKVSFSEKLLSEGGFIRPLVGILLPLSFLRFFDTISYDVCIIDNVHYGI